MASRRRRRKSIGKVVVDAERRLRRIEKRPGSRRLKNNVVTTDKIGYRAVRTKYIDADAVTPNEAAFGVNVVSNTDPDIVKDGTTVTDPDTGATKVYSDDLSAYVTVTDAQAAADAADALAAANAAADAVDGKNSVFRQNEAPTGGTYVLNDIWIDTDDGNKLYVWNGTSWVSAQDAGINAAQTTANGKNKVTYSTTTPGTTANTAGDIWWQYSGGVIIAQWTGAGGTSWTSNTLGNAVIANLDAGKITTGLLNVAGTVKVATGTSGARVEINPTGFFAYNASNVPTVQILAADGSASFTGSIQVGSTIAGTSASTVASGAVAGSTAIQPGGVASDSSFTGNNINNKINAGATTVTIDGGKITAGTVVAGSVIAGWVYAGNISANQINAGTITGIAYNNGSGTFSVSSSGVLTASSATITGTINATSGYVGNATNGWYFDSSGVIRDASFQTLLYATGAVNSAWALISNRGVSAGRVQDTASTSANRSEFNYFNAITRLSITSGYGVDSDWSPQSDNTYNLGQATSAGYSTNRRWTRLYSNNTTISTSDARLKTDVIDSPLGLDFINALRPVGYKWIVGGNTIARDEEGNEILDGDDENGKPKSKLISRPGVRRHYGFIAQEVKEVIDEAGVDDFAGWVKDNLDDPDSYQSLSYEQFIAPLVKAVQELSQRIASLESRVAALE